MKTYDMPLRVALREIWIDRLRTGVALPEGHCGFADPEKKCVLCEVLAAGERTEHSARVWVSRMEAAAASVAAMCAAVVGHRNAADVGCSSKAVYFVEGVRYCKRCHTRRCHRMGGIGVPCMEIDPSHYAEAASFGA